jgi:hypothetical protein
MLCRAYFVEYNISLCREHVIIFEKHTPINCQVIYLRNNKTNQMTANVQVISIIISKLSKIMSN